MTEIRHFGEGGPQVTCANFAVMSYAKWDEGNGDEGNGEEGNQVLPEVTDQVTTQSPTPAKLKRGKGNCTYSVSKLQHQYIWCISPGNCYPAYLPSSPSTACDFKAWTGFTEADGVHCGPERAALRGAGVSAGS